MILIKAAIVDRIDFRNDKIFSIESHHPCSCSERLGFNSNEGEKISNSIHRRHVNHCNALD